VHSVEEIVAGGLCIGCGLCESIAGSDRIQMVTTAEGRERPHVRRSLDRATWRQIKATCPGTRIEGPPHGRRSAGVCDAVWGPLIKVVEAHASDPEVRYRGSSGGVLTALGQYLLDSGRVELVLHVAPAHEAPMRSRAQISGDSAMVLAGAGARYGPAAPLRQLRAILDSRRTFALIAKPCDTTAVRNLARRDPRLRAQLRYSLSLVCGGASDLGKSAAVLSQFGIEERALTLFRYRGHGNPGPTRIETRDGRGVSLTYAEMWGDEAGWRIQSRCKICPDAIGEVADIVAGDMWPGGVPQADDEGFNAVLIRTEAGLELFEAAAAAGVLSVGGAIPVRTLDDFNPHQVAKKRAVAARLAGIRAAGGPTPRVRRLRIWRLARRAGLRAGVNEFLGAFRRARAGAFGEPEPTSKEEHAWT